MRESRKGKIKRWLKKYFAYSFVNKVFFVYLFITLAAGVSLMFLLSHNLKTIKYEQTMDMSNQILTSMDSFLENKFEAEKSIYQSFLQMPDKWETVVGTLQEDSPPPWQEEVRNSFSQTAYAVDRQFTGLYAFGFSKERAVSLGNEMDSGDFYYFETLAGQMKGQKDTGSSLVTSRGRRLSNMFSIFLLDTIHAPDDFTEDIGILGICFHARNIRQSYQKFDSYLKGQIYVLNNKGEIIYDSNAQYVEENIPFEEIRGKSGKLTKGNYIYNTVYNEHQDYYLVNLIPSAEINKEVKVLCINILGVMAAVLFAAMLLTFFGTRYFSRRLGIINATIDQVKGGKLSGFKKEKLVNDEVGYIYHELIEMCKVLENHIEKEYVYQLHQKEMELYALQAQINPHFLYNTLESIRMNLYVKGEKEESRMVYILSEMFRNIMKKDAVVTLRDEFGYVQSYLELYQFRFGDRMHYEIRVEDEIYRYATIKHILQPVIENALIHGISDKATSERPATVTIWGLREQEDILLVVYDDGIGIQSDALQEIQKRLSEDDMFRESVGIYNVNNRLKIVYGRDYQMQIESQAGEGTMVTIRIKAMMKKELEEYVQGLNC